MGLAQRSPYANAHGGVRAVGAAARPTSRRRWTPGTTCALQASQVNSDFSDFSVFFLTPGVPDRKVSPDVCFDTLSPFITAEHFQEMLSTRRYRGFSRGVQFTFYLRQAGTALRPREGQAGVQAVQPAWLTVLQQAEQCFQALQPHPHSTLIRHKPS